MIRYSAQTHPGKKREHNEDAVLALPDHGLFVVADGVGGRAAGEVASALTIETFEDAADELAAVIRRYADAPSGRPATRSSRPSTPSASGPPSGSTRSPRRSASGDDHHPRRRPGRRRAAFVAHVGDSRAWLVRDGLIRQLTEDHSMVNELVRTGQMTYEEARRSRYRSVITRAIGLYPTVQADLMSIEILPGDRLVLNTDGLSDPVATDVIENIACQDDVDTSTGKLITAALDAGGPDNISVVLVEPEATPKTEAARARAQVMEELFLFKGLPFHARLRVSRICRELFFTPGQELLHEGTTGDSMYVIVQGSVTVTRQGVPLASLTTGEHVGELGLLEDHQRTATVTGASYGSVIVIRRDELHEFCQREPALGNQMLWRMLRTLGARLSESNQALVNRTLRDAPTLVPRED